MNKRIVLMLLLVFGSHSCHVKCGEKLIYSIEKKACMEKFKKAASSRNCKRCYKALENFNRFYGSENKLELLETASLLFKIPDFFKDKRCDFDNILKCIEVQMELIIVLQGMKNKDEADDEDVKRWQKSQGELEALTRLDFSVDDEKLKRSFHEILNNIEASNLWEHRKILIKQLEDQWSKEEDTRGLWDMLFATRDYGDLGIYDSLLPSEPSIPLPEPLPKSLVISYRRQFQCL